MAMSTVSVSHNVPVYDQRQDAKAESPRSMRSYIEAQIAEASRIMSAMLADDALMRALEDTANACIACLANGGKILFAGNGGSAADAQHMAGEFVSRFAFDRPGLYAIALTTDTSILTAIGNDYGYERLF